MKKCARARKDALGKLRRRGFIYDSRGFVEQFAREVILQRGRVRSTRARLLCQYLCCGNALAFLLLANVRTWLDSLEDVMLTVRLQ